MISSTGNTENSYLYCGEQLDSTTGLYYLRARYMNPTTGTFISMDTYQGTIFDPTSLHKYLYANANPVMNSDPSGYFTLGDVNVSQAISNVLDKAKSLNYIKIYQHLKGKLNAINNALTIYDTCRQIAMIINDPNLSGWQMIEGIACGLITSLFINHMCQMKAIGPIISKVMTGYGLVSQWESIMEAANNKDWDLVGTRSVQLIISLMSLHQTCFTGETLVTTEDGQKRIDEIEVGDKVWAYDIYTGETALKEVTKVYVHEVDEILHLHTTCGDIDTTTNHPFYVIDRGWVAAGDLSVGDEVYLIDGSTAFITGSDIEKLDELIKVYNLEVADYNTYFVGDEAVLVHNYRTEEPIGAIGNASGPKGARPSDFKVNSGSDLIPTNTEFGKSTFNSMENAKNAGLTGVYWELPAGTELPDCFVIYPDGADVGGKMSYGHRSIFATISMTLEQFNELFKLLPWERTGRIK